MSPHPTPSYYFYKTKAGARYVHTVHTVPKVPTLCKKKKKDKNKNKNKNKNKKRISGTNSLDLARKTGWIAGAHPFAGFFLNLVHLKRSRMTNQETRTLTYQSRISTNPDCSPAQTLWRNGQMKNGATQERGEHLQKCKVSAENQYIIEN